MRPGGYRISAALLILALGAGAVLSSCHLGRPDDGRYVVDGVAYGVTQGPFRGRWWSYYERGRSFLEGGFYEEAVRDFETALTLRSKDQAWARTYGMHFTPEYFPNRELGAARYYQGQHEAAIEALTRSYGQQQSARTALFLGKARRAVLEATGADREAPTVAFAGTGMTTAGMRHTVRGVARDDTYVARITVGDEPYFFDLAEPEITFEHEVVLAPGQNSVPVTVTDLLGKATTAEYAIVADLDGPAVSFDTPLVLPGTVSGVLYDDTGIDRLEIAGKPIALIDAGNGEMRFTAQVDARISDGPVPFAAADTLGNVTDGVLPVDALIVNAGALAIGFASTAPRWQEVAPGLRALMAGGKVAMLVAQDGDGPSINITNVDDGDTFYSEEIVVALHVRGPEPIDRIVIDGQALPPRPEGRRNLNIKRRIRLPHAPDEKELVASVRDVSGNTGEVRRRVVRELQEIDTSEYRLAVAFLRGPAEGEASKFQREAIFAIETGLEKRFTLVARDDTLPAILQEQELYELVGDPEAMMQFRLHTAEVLFVVEASTDAESHQLVFRAVSTERGTHFLSFKDVATDKDEELELIDRAVASILQEFPRITAPVISWNSPEIEFELGKNARIKDFMKCVVYERTAIEPRREGQPLEFRTAEICQGIVLSATATRSKVEVYPKAPGGVIDYPIEPVTDPEAQEGHWVVLK